MDGLAVAVADALHRHAPPPARILALGAAPDALAKRLRQVGYHVTAYAAAVEVGELPLAPYDAVCAVQVVERLENPWLFLRTCRGGLRPGGHLLLTAPHAASVRNRLRFLVACDLDPHSITPIHAPTLVRAGRRAGLELVDDLPYPASGDYPNHPIARQAARLLYPLLRGEKAGAVRLYVLRRGG